MSQKRYTVDHHDDGTSTITDHLNGIRTTWRRGHFNDTQETTLLDDSPLKATASATLAARAMREMADFLRENYYNTLF